MLVKHVTPKSVLILILSRGFAFLVVVSMSTAAEAETCTCPSSCPCTSIPSNNKKPKLGEDSFSKLKLNVQELYGSRWALDQRNQISVYHSIDITDASLIHANQLTLHVEFNLRQNWNAPGLEFPAGLFKDTDLNDTFVTATGKVLRYMWSPDSYISTSRESDMNVVNAPLTLVYIFKNTSIIFKARMFTKVGCSSSFQWYPLDVQYCDLVIESYKYHDDIVSYNWTDPKLYRPVVIKIGRMFQYELQQPLYHDTGKSMRGGRGQLYPFVRVRFTFERKLGNNLIQVYTPTILVVVLSWFSFWLGLDAIPGRISLLVTCMLTLVTMHSGIKSSIPPVHYITMMDLWMVVCMGTVFGAMCEFIVVKYLHWQSQLQKQKHAAANSNHHDDIRRDQFFLQQSKELSNAAVVAHSSLTPVEMLRTILVESGQLKEKCGEGDEAAAICPPAASVAVAAASNKNKWRFSPLWITIDKFCRFCFPFVFCAFNAIYWPLLLHGSSELQKPRNDY